MPRTITKCCPACGHLTKEPKPLYKMMRKVFDGSICQCGHEKRHVSQWSRKLKKKMKPRICDCGCGHTGPCRFPKMKAVPDQPIKCTTPDCLSSASVEFQQRIQGFGRETG
jgi:hypothetical protein